MTRTLHAALALVVLLAGCSALPGTGTPASPERDLSVAVSNEHDVGYEFRVTAVPARVEGIEVTYENGSTRRFEVESFDALPSTALRNATAVDAGAAGGRSETFAVGPNEGFGTTLEDVPANATVVYFLLPTGGPSSVRGAGVVRCSPDTVHTDLSVTVRPDGSVHSAVTCRDDAG